MAIDDNTTYGLTGAQVKDLASKVNNLKTNAGAPTTATVGTVGQLLEDTTNGKLYICTAIVPGTDPDPDTYTWEQIAIGTIPSVVQTTGTSTTKVMSQDAVGKLLFASPGASYQKTIKIGKSAAASESDASVAIGQQANAAGSWAIAIGYSPRAAAYSIAAGVQATANGQYAEAFGRQASAGYNGSIALGAYSTASAVGEMNIGVGSSTSYGYNNTAYRLLSGVHDPQNAHDAATKGYVDGKVLQNAGAPTTATVGTVGQLLEDTTNGKVYICTDATNPYVWEEVGTGSVPVITMTSTDPGEGGALAANNFIAVYSAS